MTGAIESLKHFHFNGLLLSKVYILWAKKYRGIVFHETADRYKTWGGINLSFQNWHEKFEKIWLEHSKKFSKIFILMISFWAKYILYELRKYRRHIFHETEERLKIWREFWEESTCCFKIDIKNLTNFDLTAQRKSQKFSF